MWLAHVVADQVHTVVDNRYICIYEHVYIYSRYGMYACVNIDLADFTLS